MTNDRFAWREPSGTLLRASAVATDSRGECGDSFTLRPSDSGRGHAIAIESFEGIGWNVQAAARSGTPGP